MSTDPVRATRLKKVFEAACQGQSLTAKTGVLFLEAICAQNDKIPCINALITSKDGLRALQAAVRLDLSTTFMNGIICDVIEYISSPEVVSLSGGDFLRRVIVALADPPLFWSAYSQAFRANELELKSQVAFATFLYHILTFTPLDQAEPFREFAKSPDVMNSLLDSPSQTIRSLAQKVKLITDVFQRPTVIVGVSAPGGRHDNDYHDFRTISIVPTADEISSTEAPFLRPSDSWDDPDQTSDGRPADYLDAQFRLLREDMLYEMREEIQAMQKRKKSKTTALDGLRLQSVHYEKVPDYSNRHQPRASPWSITLVHEADIPQLASQGGSDSKRARLDWLKKNNRFLKHGSLVAVYANDTMVAFATVHREEDLLAQVPPVVVIRLEGESTVVRALPKLRTATRVKLLPVSVALFAYEPILKAMQNTLTIPLSSELLYWNAGRSPAMIEDPILSLTNALRTNLSTDLKHFLNLSNSIKLDKSQGNSFLMGLTQAAAIIQGPPGYVNYSVDDGCY